MCERDKVLREEGLVFLIDDVTDKTCASAAKDILYLCQDNEVKQITIFINSCGGDLSAAFMLTDVMRMSSHKIKTIGLGTCASAGLLILCAGDERVSTTNTAFLSHQYSWGKAGKYHELTASREEEDRTYTRMMEHYKKHSNLNKKQIAKLLLPPSDVWLSSDEMLEYNLIDRVIV